LHHTLQNAVKEYTTLEDFRRILKNYETGLRALTSVPRKAEGINSTKPNSGFRDRTTSPKPSLSKTACKCGGMHWFKDCPKRNVTSNQVNVRSSANRTPMGRNTLSCICLGHFKLYMRIEVKTVSLCGARVLEE
jgi:hypothetical protein